MGPLIIGTFEKGPLERSLNFQVILIYVFSFKFVRRSNKVPQYRGYLDFVHEVGETCGFQVEEDSLRIPSTKRVHYIE